MFDHLTKPLIMGILNLTPDSFSDGGLYQETEPALRQVQRLLAEGADIIDIGGESTRPGANNVSAEEQIRRIMPVITAIRQQGIQVPISVDTTLSEVAKVALLAGASFINDVSAGDDDTAMLSLAAELQTPIVLMHRQGTSKTMQDNPYYEDVVEEVLHYLQAKITAALAVGIKPGHIVIDPGIGFGKRKQDNLALLAQLGQFTALGFPVLLGTSRKRFMGSICNVAEPAELVTATATTTALGVMAGVKIFRVHDVLENKQALDVAWAIKCQEFNAQNKNNP
jgi:dihydropteroate synthase